MKERNHAFDLLCGICIVRMVTLHIMTMCGKNDASWWVEIMYWSYFFMSFFFFKAGYFNKGTGTDDRKYLTDRELSHLWDTSSHYGNAPTWFLFSFFMAYMVAHLLEKVPRLHWAVVVFPLVGVWLWQQGNPLWFSLNNVFMGVFFFYVGRLWAWLIRHAGRRTMFVVSFVLLVAFVACNLLWHGSYTMSNNTFKGSPWAGLVGVSLALTGIAGVLLTLRVPRIPVINFIGEHSMVFFLLHYPMLYVYKFFHLSFGRSIYHHLDEVFILVPVIFGLCAWLVPYFEAVPWLSGRPRAKTIQAEPETSSPA